MQGIRLLFDAKHEHPPNNTVSFLLLSGEDLGNMKTVSLDAEIRAVCEERGDECQVSLSGRITIDSSPDLRALLLRQLQSSSCQILTVDFCEVDYIDTSGLALLVEILKAARTQGKAFHLSGLQERPRFLLEATRLLHLFHEESAQ
jgi:anti-sigma B factor antagonist